MVNTVKEIKERIAAVGSRHAKLRAAALFGSCARNESTKTSDVDLLVSMDKSSTLADLEMLRTDAEEAFGRPVDLVTTLEGAPRYLVDGIRRDGVLVYER